MDVQKIIEVAKNDFKGQMMVAFLGDKGSGKTVHCALIKDSATQELREHTNGEFFGIGTKGSERMNRLIKKLSTGEFPAETTPDEATPMTVEIRSTSGLGGVMNIVLRDMAGEKGKDLLQDEMNVDDRLEKIFKLAPIEGKPYGLSTHLVFAKIYVLVIDVSKHKDWRFTQAYVKDMIRHLHEIKERIDETVNNKIISPFAIVFSKYDTLKKTEQKSAKEFMEELKEIKNAIETYHNGDVEYFVSEIKSTSLTKQEIIKEVKKALEDKNEDKKEAENELQDKEARKKNAKNILDAVKAKLIPVQQKLDAIQPTNDPAQIDPVQQEMDEIVKEAEEARLEYAEAINRRDDVRKKLDAINEKIAKGPSPSPEELGISTYRPIEPLTYNHTEYLSLIKWFIKKYKQADGFV